MICMSAVLLTTSGEVKIIILVVAVLLSVMIGMSITAYEQHSEQKHHEEHPQEDTESSGPKEDQHE